MRDYIFPGIIEKEGGVYCALCLELDIATESDTLEGAKKNLREAVEGYIESVVRDCEEDEFIPRPVPEEVIKEYELRMKRTKLAIIGCGAVAEVFHLPALQQMGEFEIEYLVGRMR